MYCFGKATWDELLWLCTPLSHGYRASSFSLSCFLMEDQLNRLEQKRLAWYRTGVAGPGFRRGREFSFHGHSLSYPHLCYLKMEK